MVIWTKFSEISKGLSNDIFVHFSTHTPQSLADKTYSEMAQFWRLHFYPCLDFNSSSSFEIFSRSKFSIDDFSIFNWAHSFSFSRYFVQPADLGYSIASVWVDFYEIFSLTRPVVNLHGKSTQNLHGRGWLSISKSVRLNQLELRWWIVTDGRGPSRLSLFPLWKSF